MIRVENSSVEMCGTIPTLLAEITRATKQLYDHMSETDGKEVAGRMIDLIVELAKMTYEDVTREAERMKKALEEEE